MTFVIIVWLSDHTPNLGYLVGIVVYVAHHEVIILGDDVTSHQDVWGQALGVDVLKQDRGLTLHFSVRVIIINYSNSFA